MSQTCVGCSGCKEKPKGKTSYLLLSLSLLWRCWSSLPKVWKELGSVPNCCCLPPLLCPKNPVWIGMESSFSSQAGLTAPVNSTLHSGKGFALLFLPTVLYSSITASALFFLFQDQELEELKQQVSTLKSQNEQLQVTVTQQVSQIQQHKDQYNLLKVQLGMLREE